MFIIVTQVVSSRITKYLDGFANQEDANTYLTTMQDEWPSAFVAEKPVTGSIADWLVDGQNNIVYSPVFHVDAETDYEAAVDMYLDSVARSMGYSSINTITKFILVDIETTFKTESLALANWCSDVWVKVAEIKQACEAGERQVPTVAELLAELPQFAV